MKRLVYSIVFLTFVLCYTATMAQVQVVRMDAATNGTICQMNANALIIRDDDTQGAGAPNAGSYMHGQDYILTIETPCTAPYRINIRFDTIDIDCLDTLYIYDGTSTSGTLIGKYNSYTHNINPGDIVYETPANTTGMVTLRFRTDPLTDTNRTQLNCHGRQAAKGFELYLSCGIPCEKLVPVINNKFYRTRNGVIYDSAYIKFITVINPVYINDLDTSLGVDHYDTSEFWGANLCIGDGVIFQGHGEYSHNYGYYDPSDANTYFRWDMANEGDTITGVGQTDAEYNEYQHTGCFDIRLDLTDAYGCTNSVLTSIKVRTALNPIKTIYTLQDICNNDSLMVNMGYDGEDATLTLKKIETEEAISKTYEVRTFIPDGPACPDPYFEAPVEFTEFPNSRTVTSAKDICSICVNMEHSFMGDFYMSIVCPTGQEAFLKYGNGNASGGNVPTNLPYEQSYSSSHPTFHGSGTFLGFPLDNNPWETGNQCDSLLHPFGVGLDYCFSRDTHYTLVTGDNAKAVWTPSDLIPTGNFYINSPGVYIDNLPVTYGQIPTYFTNQGGVTPPDATMNTKHPSNHEAKTDYYLPLASFSELVGCPLNGLWNMRVYDVWGADNGWIFSWSLDICNVLPDDCRYQVGVDSLVWMPDPSPQYHDYDLGHYRGVTIDAATPTISYIKSADTAGTFPIIVKVYDEFGCVWDTNTTITTYWTPEPNLGPDTMLCGDTRIVLDATDRHTPFENYDYIWTPFGQVTDTITTMYEATGDVNYVVEVRNFKEDAVCTRRDTILVNIGRQPMPNFIPDPFVFEGCAPFTINFDNRSINTVEHFWVFGDGITSTIASPTHTYDAGLYDLKYYATSADGCVDSIISPQAIAVYNAPRAAFSWMPTYPSVTNPVATFVNLTEPQTPQTKYFWEFQYNIDNPLSVETLVDINPVFDFSQYMEGDPSGNYSVRLIARTDNLAPSGNTIYCRDTTENAILVVNDFLQFPNVVSPNDDGINDRFVIKNLVEGMGYPINQLDIYNKWGARVYHKENISRDEDFWDPKDMPTGTYFYRFSARGYNGNVEHNGAIEVVR